MGVGIGAIATGVGVGDATGADLRGQAQISGLQVQGIGAFGGVIAAGAIDDEVVGAGLQLGGQLQVGTHQAAVRIAAVEQEEVEILVPVIHQGHADLLGGFQIQAVDILGTVLEPGGAGVGVDQGGAPGGVAAEGVSLPGGQQQGVQGRAIERDARGLGQGFGRLGHLVRGGGQGGRQGRISLQNPNNENGCHNPNMGYFSTDRGRAGLHHRGPSFWGLVSCWV